MGHRAWAYLVSLFLLGAVLWPLQQRKPKDDFPLSTYPMFSRARPPQVTIDHVMAKGADGREEPVPPPMVASDEVLQTKRLIADAVRRRSTAEALCQRVAPRVAAAWPWATTVEVRSDRYVVASYFTGSKKPVWRKVHASCPVGGTR